MDRTKFVFAIAALTAAPAIAQVTPPSGRLLASNCFGCHGTNGRSVTGIESLAGKSAQETYNELREIRGKPLRENIMNPHARAYTDQQLWLIADFLSRQAATARSGD